MAEKDIIDEIIDRGALEEEKRYLTDLLEGFKKQLLNLPKAQIKLSEKGGFDAVKKQSDELSLSLQELNKVQAEVAKQQAKLNILETESAKRLAENRLMIAETNKLNKEQAKERLGLVSAYERESKTLNELRKQYKDLAVAGKENTDEGRQLLAQVTALDGKLKNIDASVGQFQRNVGNYSGAVKVLKDELGNVGNQLSRLAAEGMESSDEFTKLKQQYDQLNKAVNNSANGYASASQELKALSKVAEDVAINFGRDSELYTQLIQKLGELKDEVEDTREQLKLRASDTGDLDRIINGVQALAGAYGIAEGTIALFGVENENLQRQMVKLQAIMTIVNGLQAVQNELKKKDSIFTTIQTAAIKLYTWVTAGATTATHALKAALISTGIGALLVLLPLAVQAMGEFGQETAKAADDAGDLSAAIGQLNKDFDLFNKTAERANKLAVAGAKAIGATDEQVLAIEKKGIEERIKNLKELKKILDGKYNNERLNAEQVKEVGAERQRVAEQILDLEAEIEIKRLGVQEKAFKKRQEDRKKEIEEAKKYAEELAEASKLIAKNTRLEEVEGPQAGDGSTELAVIQAATERRVNFLSEAQDLELAALENSRRDKLVTEEEYQRRKLAIETGYQKYTLMAQLDGYEQQIKVLEQFGLDTTATLAAIAAIKKQIAENSSQQADTDQQKELQRLADLKQAYQDLATELSNTFFSFIDAGFERQKNAIQEQIDMVQKRTQAEIESVNNSTRSEDEKANKIAIINARAQAQKEALEQRQRKIDQQRARFDRLQAVAGIVQNTSLGVTAALTSKPPNVPLAYAIGAIGALQLAATLAQPIPKYKDGRDGGPAELAITGDGGRSEVVEHPDGSMYVTPSVPTLTYLPAGAIVHKSVEAAAAAKGAAGALLPQQSERIGDVMDKGFARIAQAYRSRPEQRTIIGPNGISGAIKNGNTYTEYLKRNL